jgi:hypothetical protein
MRHWLMGMVTLVILAGCASAPLPSAMTSYQGQEGGLQFLVSPADADIYVDADYKGKAEVFTGPNALWLERGLHAIEVRRDGYLTFFRQIQISHGLVEVLIFSLQVDTDER